jgi:AcrR family transcriptional regulator
MNKRQLQKQQTRNKIAATARDLFTQQGFLNTTTAQIASASGIAHGTLFLHFPTKEDLILEIMDSALETIQDALQPIMAQSGSLDELLLRYLDLIEQNEALFATKAREMALYSAELRRKLLFRDAIILEHFHTLFQQGIDQGVYRSLSIQTALSFFFGSLHYHLSLRQLFAGQGSVIAKIKKPLIETFIAMITTQTGGSHA